MRWVAATLAVLALAVVLKLSLLVYACYVLLAVMLASRWITYTWAGSLRATRRTSALAAEIGDKVAVVVEITNTGRWTVAWALLEDVVPRQALIHRPPRLEVIGNRLRLLRVSPDETLVMPYQLVCHRRGYYQLGPLVIETGDLFGLHRRFRVASEPHFLTVYPDIVPLEGYDIASRRPIGEVRLTHRLFEDPTRQAGVRRYQAGDPLSRIHWRASARCGELQSKVFEPSSVAGATLLLDFHQESLPEANEPVRSELAVLAAVALAFALFEMGQQVGLVTNGRDAAERIRHEGWESDLRTRQAALAAAQPAENTRLEPIIVPTGRGPQQPLEIRRLLARLERTDGLRLAELLAETWGRIPRDATVIAILSRVSEQSAIALGNLRRSGYSVSAIINTFELDDFATASGMLTAQRIPTYHLGSREHVAHVAQHAIGLRA